MATQIQQLVIDAANQYGIDPGVALAQIFTESRFNPNAQSPAGAQGLAQFMPGTWARFGSGSPFDPSAATQAWGRYMSYLLRLFNGNISLALAGYNAGEGNVKKYGGIPPFAETRNYVSTILAGAGSWGSVISSGSTSTDSGGSLLPSEPTTDTSTVDTSSGVDLSSITPSGFLGDLSSLPTWALLLAVGITAWVILR